MRAPRASPFEPSPQISWCWTAEGRMSVYSSSRSASKSGSRPRTRSDHGDDCYVLRGPAVFNCWPNELDCESPTTDRWSKCAGIGANHDPPRLKPADGVTALRWVGAVLTGGQSSRMGRDKALIEIDGQQELHVPYSRACRRSLSPIWIPGGWPTPTHQTLFHNANVIDSRR